MKRGAWSCLFLSSVLWTGCDSGSVDGEDAGGQLDASADASAADDAGRRPACVIDEDCDDGLYCNGEERCRPASPDADGRGCVAGTSPCEDAAGCDEAADACAGDCVDADGDGHGALECGGDDCDDADPNRYPGNVEVCDSEGHDEDCNPETFGFIDADGDGAASSACCNGIICGADCNDADATVHPRAGDGPPLYCDGVDNDCSGTADEGCPCVEGETRPCGSDAQLMRIGTCLPGTQICSGGAFTAECIGGRGPLEEVCDGLDNDCNGTADNGVLRRYYEDADGDGFGRADGATLHACAPPAGFSVSSLDCDDSRANVHPLATEVCNGVDDNCNGTTDEGLLNTYYRDADGDGFGDAATSTTACAPPAGHVLSSTDCDDTTGARNPAAVEVCDDLDNNCNGMTDEGVRRTFFRDADGDGFGVTSMTMQACTAPSGYVDRGGDCNDTATVGLNINPAAYERCDGSVDDDCDGVVDDGCACTTGATRPCGPAEVGVCRQGVNECLSGTWSTACVGQITARTETCNGLDDDCDGTVDNGAGSTVSCYVDTDGDGRGTGAVRAVCPGTGGGCPAGYAAMAGDCNDTNPAVRPGATEVCNAVDDNCDGTTDNGAGMTCVQGASRAGTGAYVSCSSASGIYTCNATCTAEIFTPIVGAETCNGADDNCNGTADEGFACVRNSTGNPCTTSCGTVGTYTCSSSCAIGTCRAGGEGPSFPGTCNGCDDDGDGTADDGFACARDSVRSCTKSCGGVMMTGTQRCLGDCSGYTACSAAEVCNGCDDDLDGAVDETFTCERDRVYTCTVTECGTVGQQICNSSCTGYTTSECASPFEYCNYCDDDRDGTYQDDRGLATGRRLELPNCPYLTTTSTVGTCPMLPGFGYQTVRMLQSTTNDAAAIWMPTERLGWGQMTIDGEMIVSKSSSSALPADGWAIVIADGGTGNVGAVGGALGVPYTRTGLAIEWRFYNSDPNVDQVDTIRVRRLTGSGSGSVIAGPVFVPAARDFGNGDTSLTQNLVVSYTPDDPSTASHEERLIVRVDGVTLINITRTSGLNNDLDAASNVDIALTAATGGRVYTADARFGYELLVCGDPPCGPPNYATNIEFFETCD